ncbi:FGGY family of carbohydrate kinases, C-terminal domain [Shimia gijangensis]|uniref:FGGY family of carbohydrate kinases, C-terminal domain n=1 Tax=Shimia gijangensis TaxID=1470563 RepID=A0A1M6QW62_9RHOB|nr:FGGY family of carbohydrate kinases, C-terminal domain [Shimia gijangensis]
MLQTAGVSFDRAVMSGGGARSPQWPQMFADCLGVPITVAEAQETGALGAAIGAGVGVGQFADYEQGIAAMTVAKKEFLPNQKMKNHYEMRFQAFLEMTNMMRRFWTTLKNSGDKT